jgi:lysophospholipid hydrolase
VQLRLAYVSCVRQLEEVRNAEYCDYIRPPIDKYGTLQFDAFEEIRDVGYYHGQVRSPFWVRNLYSKTFAKQCWGSGFCGSACFWAI